MTLRKTTIDDSVKNVPQNEQTQSISRETEREKDSKSNMIMNSSLSCKNKKLSQNKKKFNNNITGVGFKIS